MSTSKNKKPNMYDARIKALKTLGLVKTIKPTKKNPLSASDKSKVNKLWKEWNEIANNPEDFKKVNVTKLSDSDLKLLKNSGYKILNGQALLPKQGYDSATIKKEWTKDADGNPVKILQIKRTQSLNGEKRKVQTEFVGTNLDKMGWRDRLIAEYEGGKFKEGERIGLKVYDNSPMVRSEKLDIKDLLKYAEAIQWKHTNDPTNLLNNLHLVKTWVKGNNEADLLKSTKDINKKKYQKKKQNAITRTRYKKHPKGK